MRVRINMQFVVDADCAQVMGALAAVEMLPKWAKEYVDARVAARDEAGRPLRAYVTSDRMGSKDMQVLEYDWAEDRVSWQVTDSAKGAKGGATFELSDGADGTEVAYRAEFYEPIPLPGLLVKRTVRKINEVAIEKFIEFAEQYSGPKSATSYSYNE